MLTKFTGGLRFVAGGIVELCLVRTDGFHFGFPSVGHINHEVRDEELALNEVVDG